jgi:multiple sugar transport system permease protein
MKNELNPGGNRESWRVLGFILIIFIFLVFTLFPFLWIVLTSVKSQKDLFAIPPLFFFKPTLEHWQKIVMRSEFLRYYKNSLVIAVSTVVFVMVIATLAAYGLVRGRYKSKVRDNIAFFILSQRMMPPVAVVLPIYILFAGIKMLDRIQTLIFMNIAFNLPLSIWMIRGFVDGLSNEIEEAAVVDGCTPFGAFFKVGIPQISPGLLTTALLVFIYTINEFFFALLLSGTRARPVSVAVQLFLPTGVRGTLFGEAAVASILIMLPSLIFAIFLQRYLVEGISLGALKG